MTKKRIIGIDIKDIGESVLSAAHLAGKAVLSAFGAGSLAAPVEQLESPYLKDWARSSATQQQTDTSVSPTVMATTTIPTPIPLSTVHNPDFVVIVHSNKKMDYATAVASAMALGGHRFNGNGYKSVADIGQKFSFGIDIPHSVVLVGKDGKKSTPTDVKQILFAGGGIEDNSSVSSVAGDDPLATLEGSATMAENNNLNLNERERIDFDRANGGDEFSGEGGGYFNEIVGETPDYGTETPESGTDEDLVGAKTKSKPAGGVRNPHGYKHGEYVFGDEQQQVLGAAMSNPYLKGTLALTAKPLAHTTPTHAGFQIKTTPKGRKFTSLVVNRAAKHDPKKTLASARAVAARAQQVGNTALKAIANKQAATAKIHGIGAAVTLSPGIAALKQKAQSVVDAGKKLSGVADKYEKVVKAMPAKAQASASKAKKITKIVGDGFNEIVGDEDGSIWAEIVGAVEQACDALDLEFTDELLGALSECVGVDANGLYPGMPGYNPATDPDASAGGGTNPTDPNATTAGGTASGVPGPPDYGAGTTPTLESVAPQADVDFMPDPNPAGDDQVFYDAPTDNDLPLGAVVFDGSRVPPFQGLGNYTVFFGQLPGSGPPKGGPNSGYSFHKPGDGSDSGWWLELMGAQPSFNYNGAHNFDHIDQFGTWVVGESQKNNWGPLIGNPQGGWTKGLRFSPSGPNGPRWFWFYDTAAAVAPWAVQAILQQRLNDAIVAYKAAMTAGQTDYVNAQLQDKLNAQQAATQAQAQAASDAQIAMQQQQSDAKAAAAQSQQNTQASALLLQEQQQADAQAAAQAQLQQQAQAAQLSYFQQHPEQMFTSVDDSAQQAQMAPEDGGIDWGGSNSDGSAEEAALSAADSENGDVSADDLTSEG